MYRTYLKRAITCGIMALLSLLLTACDTSGTTGNSNSSSTQPPLIQGTSIASTPGIGPTAILTPTIVPGGNAHSQLVVLTDRTLAITSVSKQAIAGSDSTAISLAMTIKNTSTKPIMNKDVYFQLISAEGDAFGLQPNVASSFFGTIAPQSSRSGTIVFQVPTAAANKLQLLYRPEVAAEAVSIALNMS